MANVTAEGLWMERNACYAMIIRELFGQPLTGHYKHLKELKSDDAADKGSWQMAVEYMHTISSGGGLPEMAHLSET